MIKKSFFLSAYLLLLFAATAQRNTLPIGVFDSGTGGLTVLEAILTLDAFRNSDGAPGADGIPDFAKERFQYLADQANMPYGNYAAAGKTDLLKEHVLKNMAFLLGSTAAHSSGNSFAPLPKETVKMLIVACNTATAYAIGDIKKYVSGLPNGGVPVVGVINAGSLAAIRYLQKKKGTVGVFATAGTVASNGYPLVLQAMADSLQLGTLSIVSQGGFGLAESIDRDWSFLSDQARSTRAAYKGPSLRHPTYPIDSTLLGVYGFVKTGNSLLCEYDDQGRCIEMQLNDPVNYVRYHLVSLLEKMREQQYREPLNTLILGCTHYPYLRDTIASVLTELYSYQDNSGYRYRTVLASHVELIDPAIETAKEAYLALRQQKLAVTSNTSLTAGGDAFFISVPNTLLTGVQLQEDGWFTNEYKYGRRAGEQKQFVQFVPFDTRNIAQATYERFRSMLPACYGRIKKTF
ncbi:MAG: Asp/Glu/hydantoin racemase [Chitinophagales bacterium]|jgi:glutamate racemase|nr:Asp/Glu/hydantoin racemase [Chitinophagales bacterium]